MFATTNHRYFWFNNFYFSDLVTAWFSLNSTNQSINQTIIKYLLKLKNIQNVSAIQI